jgi:hypothetical protein
VTQVESIAGSVEDTVRKETGKNLCMLRGLRTATGFFSTQQCNCACFLSEYRNFYSLESLWADAGIEKPEDVVKEKKAYVRKGNNNQGKGKPADKNQKPGFIQTGFLQSLPFHCFSFSLCTEEDD